MSGRRIRAKGAADQAAPIVQAPVRALVGRWRHVRTGVVFNVTGRSERSATTAAVRISESSYIQHVDIATLEAALQAGHLQYLGPAKKGRP